jgi:hypothetical protein
MPPGDGIAARRLDAEYQAHQLQAMRDACSAVESDAPNAEGERVWMQHALAEGWLQTLTSPDEVTRWQAAAGEP